MTFGARNLSHCHERTNHAEIFFPSFHASAIKKENKICRGSEATLTKNIYFALFFAYKPVFMFFKSLGLSQGLGHPVR